MILASQAGHHGVSVMSPAVVGHKREQEDVSIKVYVQGRVNKLLRVTNLNVQVCFCFGDFVFD